MKTNSPLLLLAVTLGLALAGCGKPPVPTGAPEASSAPAQEATTPPAAPAAAPEATGTAEGTAAPPLPRNPSPPGATLAITSPRSGDVVSSPVRVVMDLEGMSVAPAGDPAPNSGHHHLLVDVPMPDLGQPIPKDAQHLHFGQGQTEAEIPLPPGPHTLQLVLGDANHVPHNPPLISAPVTITVK